MIRSARVTSASSSPTSATTQQPANAVTSSAGVLTQPAESFKDPVAQAIAKLRCRWFMPEAAVAQKVGLESATALRAWTCKQELGVDQYGGNVDAYDGAQTEYWLLGDRETPTASSLGISWTCSDQRYVVNFLEKNCGAVRHGVYNAHDEPEHEVEWNQIVDLAYGYPDMFYMTKTIDDFHSGRFRLRPRDIEAQFVNILRDMINEGIVDLSRDERAHSTRKKKTSTQQPSPKIPAPAVTTQPRRKVSFFCKTGSSGRPRACIETELSYGLFEELCVPQAVHG